MTFSDAEFNALVEAASDSDDLGSNRYGKASPLSLWATELGQMLAALAQLEFNSKPGTPLRKLCESGARYGLQRLEARTSSRLHALISARAGHRLKSDLERNLIRITRPCLALEFSAFRSAVEAIHPRGRLLPLSMMERKFLGGKPCHRLFPMFKRFPVLARLWSQLICQWCDQTHELLLRFAADRRALSRVFFRGQPFAKITDLRAGLSDPHNGGRTVMLLRFGSGSVIYKPRPGHGEEEWHAFIEWMNVQAFRPKVKAGAVLLRDGYCWMEEIKFAPCKNQAAVRRFYERLGGMIAAAFLLRAVDCHRDNVIALGEQPVLVDAETLGHSETETQVVSPLNLLHRTGFFPYPGEQSTGKMDSSVLGKMTSGRHNPRIGRKPLSAARYKADLIRGFRRAWRCILGSAERRAEFNRLTRRLQRHKLRRIHWPTANYDRIRRASIQPDVLRSALKRDNLIRLLCRRNGVSSAIIAEEVLALKRFDIPHFTHHPSAFSRQDSCSQKAAYSDAVGVILSFPH